MSDRNQKRGQAAVRIALGLVFTFHGMQKVFAAFGGHGLSGFASYMATVTSVMPTFTAYAIAFGELLGGIALLLGCFHRLASFGILLIMLGGLFLVHGWDLLTYPNDSRYAFILGAMALAVFLGGPGSCAYKIEFKKNQEAR